MKLIKKIKIKNKSIYKAGNIIIYSTLINHRIKYEKFFNIISKIRKYTIDKETKKIKIFGISVYERSETENFIYSKSNFHTKYINKLSALKKYLNKNIDKKFNKIFILKSNLGEAYIFLKYIINHLNNQSDTILIAGTKESHIILSKLLLPNIATTTLKKALPETNNNIFKIGEQTFYIAFPLSFYINTERQIAENNAIYIDEIYKYFNIKDTQSTKNNILHINKSTITKVDNYLNQNNIKNFVFLAKEAKTCNEIPKDFWQELEKEISIKIIKNNENMSIEEAFYLASKSQVIISLRSGLSEILSETGKTQIILYTDFSKRFRFKPISKEQILSGYSIKTFNKKHNNLFEIKYTDYSKSEIIKYITETINKKELTT